MTDDAELLRRYADEKSEQAFAELVRRHLGLVYHAALRQCGGDAHRAQDVAQAVFTDVARKARSLARRPALAGWLHTSTRYAAAQAVRGEVRRQRREQEAHAMNEILAKANGEDAAAAEWERMRPVIDEALHGLSERDREAVLARFFEGRAFAEIGARLRMSEDAARMRVERALDKLRGELGRRGVNSTAAALALALGGHAVVAAPAGLAATVTGAALAGGGVVAAGAAAGGAWMTFMTMIKLQLGISSALAVAGATGWVLQAQNNGELRDEVAGLRRESATMAAARAENVALKHAAAEVTELRGEGAQLERLSEEAAVLKVRMAEVARAQAAQAAQMALVERKTLDRQPRATFQARPEYPADLRKLGVGGEVTVAFIVDAKGQVRNAYSTRLSLTGIQSAESAGRALAPGSFVKMNDFVVSGEGGAPVSGIDVPDAAKRLTAAAIEAVSQWKFDPGTKGGRDVNTLMTVPIVFKIANGSGASSEPTSK